MFNKIIYVIREPRCGGSFLSSYIGNKITERWYAPMIGEVYIDTHDFARLDDAAVDPNAFIIRIDRRNLTEHFLSIKAADSLNWKFTNLTPEHPNDPLWNKIKNSRITIDSKEVYNYIERKIQLELKFLETVTKHNVPYHRVWYEDAFKGPFDIPELDIYNLDPASEKGIVATYKLPDYKREVFTNYDQVSKWMEKTKNAYIKKHNLEKLFEYWTSNTSS